MGLTSAKHRPLKSGLKLTIARISFTGRGRNRRRHVLDSRPGTLTAVARRGGRLVLVTNQHVLAGFHGPPATEDETPGTEASIQGAIRNLPDRPTQQMFQVGTAESDRVGRSPRAKGLVDGVSASNKVDVGACVLMSGVKAAYAFHSHVTAPPETGDTVDPPPVVSHMKYYVAGTKKPTKGMKLWMVGA